MMLTIRRLLDGQVHQLDEEEVDALGPAGLGLGGVEDVLELRQVGLGGGDDDLVLGPVLVVDGRLRHAEGVGDHPERRAADAVPGEQVERGGDDPGLGRV